jgi:hypothetical protein
MFVGYTYYGVIALNAEQYTSFFFVGYTYYGVIALNAEQYTSFFFLKEQPIDTLADQPY